MAWRSIPYGKPLRNQTFHVLKADLSPCPVHVPGKLFIGGVGLAEGYWRDSEKTAARFVVDRSTGARLYDTGDLGRYLPSGDIELLGRDDFQVKIRGHRVELGEIEATLVRHPMVEAAVVVAAGDRDERQLVAYVVPKAQVDIWDASDPMLIRDPIERMAFTLRQPGLPSKTGCVGEMALPGGSFDDVRRAAFLARQSYRRFAQRSLSIAALAAWLGEIEAAVTMRRGPAEAGQEDAARAVADRRDARKLARSSAGHAGGRGLARETPLSFGGRPLSGEGVPGSHARADAGCRTGSSTSTIRWIIA